MNRLIHEKTLSGLAMALLGFTSICAAQQSDTSMSVPALGCGGGANCPDRQVTVAAFGGAMMGPAQVAVVSSGGMGFALQENADVVKNLPYQAQAVTEMKQTLADGSHIRQTTTATVARDSDGRTVRIQKLSTIGPWKSASDSSQSGSPTLTSIFDPVAMTHTDYTSDNNVAHVLSMPAPPASGQVRGTAGGFATFAFADGPGGGGPGPQTFSVQGHAESPQSADPPDVKAESLGTKTVEGVSVTGTRDTTTILAGTIGNDKDLVITRETWYSPDLKMVIQSTQSDPRFGETTYSLTNVQRSEPDPALFQVPAGYKTEKVPAPMPVPIR